MKWILEDSGGSGRLPDRQRRIAAFMRAHPVGVLSSVDAKGNPHGAVVYFSVDECFVIRVLTKKGMHKTDSLLRCSQVMLTQFDEATQTTVQVTGLAFERDDAAAVATLTRRVRELAEQRGGGQLSADCLRTGDLTMVVIEPVQIRMAEYAPTSIDNRQVFFDTIETFTPI